jgi:hypothetical protein
MVFFENKSHLNKVYNRLIGYICHYNQIPTLLNTYLTYVIILYVYIVVSHNINMYNDTEAN